MRFLITGGAGFIGSHLASRLVARGDEVVILDQRAPASAGAARFIEASIFDEGSLNAAAAQVDTVFHLARPWGGALNDAARQAAASGAFAVLNAAWRSGRRVIVAGAEEIYARFSRRPLDEFACFSFALEHGLPVTVARLYNVVGSAQSEAYGSLLSRFVRAAMAGQDLTIFGDGARIRSFCSIEDVVDALCSIADRPETSGQLFDIGSNEGITISDLAAMVIARAGTDARVRHIDAADAPPHARDATLVPNIAKAQRELGFLPRWGIQDMIGAVLADRRGVPLPHPEGPRANLPALGIAPISPPASAARVSVIVPAFNEAKTIVETVRRIKGQSVPVQLIVVDDGSTDSMHDELASVSDLVDTLITFPENRGKGSAMRAGMEAATGEVIVFQDADLELDPADIGPLSRPILAGEATVAYGSRMHAGNRSMMTWRQWWGNRLVVRFSRALYRGHPTTDVASAAKAMRREYAQALELQARGFEIEPEMVAKLARMHARAVEIPIGFRPRRKQDGKKVKMRHGLSAMRALARYRFWRPDYRLLGSFEAVVAPLLPASVVQEPLPPPMPPVVSERPRASRAARRHVPSEPKAPPLLNDWRPATELATVSG